MQSSVWMRVALAALIASTLCSPAAAAADDTGASVDGFAHHLANLINGYRAGQGLGPLTFTDDLQALAGEHSASMSQRQQLSHDGFRTRFRRASSKLCVENVAWNYPTAESVLQGWRLSPAHHRNLLEPRVSHMGIAVATHYVTFFACR